MTEMEPFDQFAMSVGRDAWDLFRRDPVTFILASLAATIVTCVSLGLLAGVVHVGFVELVRRARRGEPVSVGVIFSRFDALVPSLVAFLIIGVAFFIGMFLLVVPAFVVAFFSLFVLPSITYENTSGVDAIKRSIDLVRNNIVYAITLLVGVMILQFAGSLVIVGGIVTSPIALIALTVTYERLAGLAPAPSPAVLSI